MAIVDPTTEDQIQRLLEHGVKLPSLSGMGVELMAQLRRPVDAIEIPRLAEQIEMEPTLAARILRVANSPAYGAMRGVTRVGQAIIVMGLDETLTLVNYYLLRRMFHRIPAMEGFNIEDFWRHSLAVAATARLLGQPRYLVGSMPGELYTAGLLHDIGKIVLAGHLPEAYGEALARAHVMGTPVFLAEREAFGADHATLAGQLLDNWNLPYSILDSIACHHDPEDAEPENRERAALIEYADVLAVECGAPASSWGERMELSQTWICRNRPECPLASEAVRVELERDVTAMLMHRARLMNQAEQEEAADGEYEATTVRGEIRGPDGGCCRPAASGSGCGLWSKLKNWFN